MPSKDVLVCGTLNLETTLPIGSFPVGYESVHYRRFELGSNPSGVGFNVARALSVLGNRVRFVSMIGPDLVGRSLRGALEGFGLSDEFVLSALRETPQSVVLFDNVGRRMVQTDLKGETEYDSGRSRQAVRDCPFAVMTNAPFFRQLLALTKAAGASVATDLQTASERSRVYDADFLEFADVIFLSHEKLEVEPEAFAATLWKRSNARVVVVGMGASGVLLWERGNEPQQVQAVAVRPVVNTGGAGDALFSCFLHFYWDGDAPLAALRKAVAFAGYKVGEEGASRGFLSETKLLSLIESVSRPSRCSDRVDP